MSAVYHLGSGSSELVADEPGIIIEVPFESFELCPVEVQACAEESDTKRSYLFWFAWFNKPTAISAKFEMKNLTQCGR
ncbi:MAG: hypothetical protein ACLP2Y_15040 [Limisphaerales bacterium]